MPVFSNMVYCGNSDEKYYYQRQFKILWIITVFLLHLHTLLWNKRKWVLKENAKSTLRQYEKVVIAWVTWYIVLLTPACHVEEGKSKLILSNASQIFVFALCLLKHLKYLTFVYTVFTLLFAHFNLDMPAQKRYLDIGWKYCAFLHFISILNIFLFFYIFFIVFKL